jgi:hypothetical protein
VHFSESRLHPKRGSTMPVSSSVSSCPATGSTEGDIPIYRSGLPEAKKLSDLFSVVSDMQLVVNILNRLIAGEKDEVLLQSLFSAALITYRRCFTTGVRNGLKNSDTAGLSNNANGLHEFLRAQADKLIAHSVNPFEKAEVGIMVRDGKVVGSGRIYGKLVNLSEDQLKQWGRLTVEVFEAVLKPRIAAADAAFLTAAQKLPIHEITKMPVLSIKTAEANEADQRRP